MVIIDVAGIVDAVTVVVVEVVMDDAVVNSVVDGINFVTELICRPD